jgi:alpha-tubulin suppressor-like RCC1 family protein
MSPRGLLRCAVFGSVGVALFIAACVGDNPSSSGTNPGTDSGSPTPDGGGGDDAGTTDSGSDAADATCSFPASPYLQDAVQVAVGFTHACAIRIDGSLVCWGDNTHGQLGVDQVKYPTTAKPVTVPIGAGNTKMVKVVASDTVTMVIDDAHHVWTWGANASGEGVLGQGTTDNNPHPTPTEVLYQGNPLTASDIALGGYHACVVTTTAAIYCWGQNLFGQVTPGVTTPDHYAAPTQTYANFGTANTRVFSGNDSYVTCAIAGTGADARCWGLTPVDGVVISGQAGDTVDGQFESQIEDGGLVLPLKSFGFGNNTGCLIDGMNHVGCGGSSSFNMLDPSGNKAQYTIAPSLGATAQIAHANLSICTLDTAGAAHCWGQNNLQQLGKGGTDTTTSGVPATVVGIGGVGTLSQVTSLAAGYDNECAILKGACPGGGPVVCWGDNSGAQLGRADAGVSSGAPDYVQAP